MFFLHREYSSVDFRFRELFAMHADNPDLWVLEVPIRRNGVENQAKIAALAGFDGRCRDWLQIDIGLAGADEGQRKGQPLGKLTHIAVETDLDGDRGESLISMIRDLTVDISDLGSREAGRLAHLEAAYVQVRGVGVGRGHAGSVGGLRIRVPVTTKKDKRPETEDYGGGGNRPGKPWGGFAGLVRSEKAWFFLTLRIGFVFRWLSRHHRDCTCPRAALLHPKRAFLTVWRKSFPRISTSTHISDSRERMRSVMRSPRVSSRIALSAFRARAAGALG